MSEPARFEEVRRKLRERGYLEGPIERFLLRDLLASTSPLRATFGAIARASLLGAPLLGGILAGSVVSANRPLLGAVDAALVWLYLTSALAIPLLLVNLLAASIAIGLAKRRGARRGDAMRAALVVAIPLLGSIAWLGWGGEGKPRNGIEWAFLGGEMAATIAVAWLGGLAALAAVAGRTGQVPDRRRRQTLGLAALTVALCGVFLFTSSALRTSGPRDASPFRIRPSGDRLLFVGVDGLDGSLVETLEARGAVAGLLRAMSAGAVMPKRREPRLDPPEVWTTLLTGMPSSAHGVRGVGATVLPGVTTPLGADRAPISFGAALRFLLPARRVPTSGASRTVRTLWEIVGLTERSASVGFWASWPARTDGDDGASGFVVSDRVLAKLLSGKSDDRDVAPGALFDRLRADFDGDRSAIRQEFEARFAGLSGEATRRISWESFLIDAYGWRTARRLQEDPSIRAAFVYLPGLDILRMRLAGLAKRGTTGRLEEAEAIEAYVRWLDALLAEALRPDSGRTSIVVADPGRSASPETEGFLVVSGKEAKSGCVAAAIGDLDVAPLTLALLGYPRSDEMPGRSSTACLATSGEPASIPTFGRRRTAPESLESAYDPDILERLRSLGYLE